MEIIALKDPMVYPADEVLKKTLGESYEAWNELMAYVADQANGLTPLWNFYRDGNAWLCKVQHKKKTVFWLSVWERHFKMTFYVAEKHADAVKNLDIAENIRSEFKSGKSFGRLKAIVLQVTDREQLPDAFKIIDFKKTIK